MSEMLNPLIRTVLSCLAFQSLHATPALNSQIQDPKTSVAVATKFFPATNIKVFPAGTVPTLMFSDTLSDESNPLISMTPDSAHPLLSPRTLDFQRRKKEFARSLRIAVPLIAVGAFANSNSKIINKFEVREERLEHFPHVKTNIDNYLALAPIGAVYAMDALGYKGAHNIGGQTALLLKSQLIMTAIVAPVKKYSHVLRPDGSTFNSFPSGHTAQAFLSAEFLRKEYGKDHPWLAVSGYVAATSVGALRILKDRHWVSDVIAGAGVGILSVNLAYLTQNANWPFNGKRKISVTPTYTGSGPGLYMSWTLGKN